MAKLTMENYRRQNAIKRQVDLGLVEMGPDGRWHLTQDGRNFLDDLQLLMEMDDRPSATQESAPWRTAPPAQHSGAAASSESQRAGDDGGPRRGSRRRDRS